MPIGKRTFQSSQQIAQLLQPGAYSRVDSVRGQVGFVSATNAVIMGQCTGGAPQTLLQFNNPADAVATLQSGPLMDAIRMAFSPSSDGFVPQTLYAMRVNTAVQATYVLKDGSANAMITLTSRDYGLARNQITVALANGSTSGKKLTLGYTTSSEVYDNIIRNSITITHASATGTVTNTSASHQLVLSVGAITILFATYNTMAAVAAYINQQAGYTAVVTPGQETADPSLLDGTVAVSLVGGAIFQSTMQAIIDAVNQSSGLASAVASNAAIQRTIPANVATTYMTGGTEGSYTASEWTSGLAILESKDIELIATPDASTAFAAQIATHCANMWSVTAKRERQFLVGGAWADSVATAVTNSQSLNSKYGLYAFNGFTQRDINGVVQQWGSGFTACLLLGLKAALAVSEPLTAKHLNVIALENTISSANLDTLILNAVCPVNYDENNLPAVVRQVNTYQTDDLKWNEFSCVMIMGFMSRDLRAYLKQFIGRAATAITNGVLVGAIQTRLQGYDDLGLIIAGSAGNSYWGISVVFAGDTATVNYDANITAPVNFIFITQHFHDVVTGK